MAIRVGIQTRGSMAVTPSRERPRRPSSGRSADPIWVRNAKRLSSTSPESGRTTSGHPCSFVGARAYVRWMTTPVLLMIDVQRNMLEPPTPVPNATAISGAIAEILESARDAGATVVHVRNNGTDGDPDEPGTDGWQLIHPVLAGELVVDKTTSDSFAGTELGDVVPDGAPIVVIGMQSEYCVRATSLAALARRHPVTVVSGAHATYDDDKPAIDISNDIEDELRAAGATIRSVDDTLF